MDEMEVLVYFASDTMSDWSSSSSSEEEEPVKITKIDNFVDQIVAQYDLQTFKRHFRMKRETINELIDNFERSEYSTKTVMGVPHISNETSVLLTIWYLVNTESFRQISDRFNVSFSSAHRSLLRVIDFLISIKTKYIKWPNDEEKVTIEHKFKSKQNINGIIGAIDCSHVKINRPKKDQDSYCNRKGYHSLIIQAVVDCEKIFLDVYCGEPGSLHDARVLRKSTIYKKAENPQFFKHYYLLGDSAYPSMSWLVPPFKDTGALSKQQKQFNYKHSSTRIVVEKAFGLLKSRYRRLLYLNNINVKFCVKIIMVCCILHNTCIIHSDEIEVDENVKDEENRPRDHVAEFVQNINVLSKREEIFRQMFPV